MGEPLNGAYTTASRPWAAVIGRASSSHPAHLPLLDARGTPLQLFVQAHRGNEIASRPKYFRHEVGPCSILPRYRDHALTLHIPDHVPNRLPRRYTQTQVHMIRHQMSFQHRQGAVGSDPLLSHIVLTGGSIKLLVTVSSSFTAREELEPSIGENRRIPSRSRQKARMRELIIKPFSILIPLPQPSPWRDRGITGIAVCQTRLISVKSAKPRKVC